MSEPREVEHAEADVEFVFRNETHHLYAVVFHYEDGYQTPKVDTRAAQIALCFEAYDAGENWVTRFD